MKKIFIMLLIILSLVLVSCRVREKYDLLETTDDISEITIVELSFDENKKLIETELSKIDDTAAFMEDFRDVKCYVYFGDPVESLHDDTEDIVIKISYKNGSYELINWYGQSEYTEERDLQFYAGYSVFDEEEFEALIEKYRK